MKIQKIFKLPLVVAVLAAAIITGCSKNDGVIGPNFNSSQVSFQISKQVGNFGGTQFLFRPSVDAKISTIICKLEAQQFADTISFANTNYVYSKDTTYIIGEYTGIEIGQQWKMNFTGALPSQNNSSYNVTSNYTVN